VEEEDIVITEEEHLGETIIVNTIKVNMEIEALGPISIAMCVEEITMLQIVKKRAGICVGNERTTSIVFVYG
jgi:hypothetical protein